MIEAIGTMTEIFVSTDIETDGPIPGTYSLLSFGSAAYLDDKTLVDTFTVNLKRLPNASEDAKTMAWWKKNPKAWNLCRQNQQDPESGMIDYLNWLKKLDGKPVFVGYPAAFDFMFIYWYLITFTKESPFSFSAIDIKTMAMVLLNRDYRSSTKENMPKEWFDNFSHSHIPLEDAIEQGALFCNILEECRRTF